MTVPARPALSTWPTAEEVAATLLCGVGAAGVGPPDEFGPAEPGHAAATRSSPVLHGLTRGGDVVLVLAGHDVITLGLDRAHFAPAQLDIVSAAPVPDVHLPRARLHAHGTAQLLAAHRARTALLAAHSLGCDLRAAAEEWCASAVVLFRPDHTRLHAHGRCARVGRVGPELADPLAEAEVELIHHLERGFGADLVPLVRSFDTAADGASERVDLSGVTRVRVVGADRLGLSLLALRPQADPVSLRMPFAASVATPDEALRMVVVAVVGMQACLRGDCGRCRRGSGTAVPDQTPTDQTWTGPADQTLTSQTPTDQTQTDPDPD